MSSRAALRVHLLSHKAAIVDRWLQLSDADHELDIVGRLTRKEFRNNMPAALDAFCEMLVAGKENVRNRLKEEVAKHGHHRWKQGFSLMELIRDWGHYNRVLTEMVDDFFSNIGSDQQSERSAAFRCLADYLSEAVSLSVERFDDLRRAEAASLVSDLEATKRRFEEVTQARGKLLRQVAHDLRGGLTSITGASGYLRAAGAEPETLSEMLDIMDSGVNSVLEMLTSLLDVSRIESGAEQRQLSTVDMGRVLAELGQDLQPLAREKGLNLVAEGSRDMLVETDPAKVRRIAQNLLVNAIQYTFEGEVRIQWEAAQDQWFLVIEDTGPGIQDVIGSEVAQELDDKDSALPDLNNGAQSAYQGEGIGLTIVKQLCSLLDAGISMKSQMGQGTKFTVEFPLAYEPSNAGEDDRSVPPNQEG